MTPTEPVIPGTGAPFDAAALERLVAQLRPKLHRYCARITGSVIDGEDVLHEALVKAIEALPTAAPVESPERWIFRIAHNTALDFLRHRARVAAVHSDEDVTMVADPAVTEEERLAAAASLHTFMQLPVFQRSTVILKDVLGYSVEEIAAIFGEATVAAVKSTLHRGRARLRELAAEPQAPHAPTPVLDPAERSLLATYIDRFNARDFDALRSMLANEVNLDLVSRTRVQGRAEVSKYYGYYERLTDWRFALGAVEGRIAALAFDPRAPSSPPVYFVLLRWGDGKLTDIRDFRYARYITDGAEWTIIE
jgi:RNA polymerase sigma-70 factor, ECF subfamily